VHKSWVAALSPDGKTAVIGSWDGHEAQLCNAATGAPLGAPLQHQGRVEAAVFSPDGRMLLTGCKDQAARLWHVADGRLHGRPLVHPAAVSAVAFSPDGQTVLIGCEDSTARFWDTATGKPLGPPLHHQLVGSKSYADRIREVVFSPVGRSALTATAEGNLRSWAVPVDLTQVPVERVAAWVQSLTDRNLDATGVAGWQTPEGWRECQGRLRQLGGAPLPGEDNLAWHRREARACLRDMFWYAAAWHLDRLIPAEPKQWQHYADRGQAHQQLGQNDQAIADYTQAIALGAGDAEIWRKRGLARKALRRWDEARADFSAAIQRNSKDHEAYYQRGLVHAALNDADKAAADQAAAFGLAPEHYAREPREQGSQRMAKREWRAAIADFTRALTIHSADLWSLYSRGQCYANLGRHEEAIADFKEIIRLEADHATDLSRPLVRQAHMALIKIYEEQERWPEAECQYRLGIASEVNNPG
jgi:tetratricopeptide (TPR) repeat protein